VKIRYFYSLLLFFLPLLTLNSKEIVLDKIIARVNGRNILKSHLEESRITKSAKPFSLDELITDEVIVQKAEELGCTPSANDLEAAINAEKIEFGGKGMTHEEFERERLQSIGLTLQQYRTQLYRFHSTEHLIGRLITNKLVISAQEIEDYYKKNPVYTEETFHIMLADVENNKKKIGTIRWLDFGWFTHSQLDDVYRKAVVKLKPGQTTHKPISKDGKLRHIMLKDHKKAHIEPLSTRYNEIKLHLKEERREPFVKNFVADIKTKAYISFP
jgi:hypothetical protein